MNIERLKLAKERLMTMVDPKRFDMGHWQKIDRDSIGPDRTWYSINGLADLKKRIGRLREFDLNKHTCGTAGCFAGWLPTIFKDDPEMKRLLRTKKGWEQIVGEFFGLDRDRAEYLWGPGKYVKKQDRASNTITREEVCKHIDNLLRSPNKER